MSTNRAARGVFSSPTPKDAQGNKLCRNCRGPMPPKRRHNCSEKCSEEWVCKTSPTVLRRRVFERDRGVCVQCHADTVAIKREYDKLRDQFKNQPNWYTLKEEFLRLYKIPFGRVSSDFWDADHIVPVIEGGGECTLENMRTRCIPCHKQETATLAKRRARERHEARPLPLFDGVA